MTQAKPPKVSVCMPVYNGAKYIAESINSVLSQTHRDLRLIITDNCSTDDTQKIVKSFADSRIAYHRNTENIGLVGNWNRVLSLADGEYFCIWAHDDVMLPENIERKVAVLDKHPSVGFVHSNLLLINGQGEVISEHWVPDSTRDYLEPGIQVFERYLKKMTETASIFIGSVLARRSCYQELGGFHPGVFNTIDSEFLMRLLLFHDAACLAAPLVKYRTHPDWTSAGFSGTVKYLDQHYRASKIILETYKDRIPDARRLKREIRSDFGQKALEAGFSEAIRGDTRSAWAHWRLTAAVCPAMLSRLSFWRLFGRLSTGKPGMWVYQHLRPGVGTVNRT
jgi:glycosyltransferase involved in cell wall biosynthesis